MRSLAPGILLCVAIALFADRLAGFTVLKVFGPLTLALILGIALRAAAGPLPWSDLGSKFCARPVLRTGVFLMGARLDFALVARVGPRVLLLDLVLICVGLVGIAWLARTFAVPAKLATLLAVGTSICGASAVVAAGAVTRADEEDVTLAVALCGILGTVGVLFYVLAGPLLPLSMTQLAILCGSTLHEVAQVDRCGVHLGSAHRRPRHVGEADARRAARRPRCLALGFATARHGKVSYTLASRRCPGSSSASSRWGRRLARPASCRDEPGAPRPASMFLMTVCHGRDGPAHADGHAPPRRVRVVLRGPRRLRLHGRCSRSPSSRYWASFETDPTARRLYKPPLCQDAQQDDGLYRSAVAARYRACRRSLRRRFRRWHAADRHRVHPGSRAARQRPRDVPRLSCRDPGARRHACAASPGTRSSSPPTRSFPPATSPTRSSR